MSLENIRTCRDDRAARSWHARFYNGKANIAVGSSRRALMSGLSSSSSNIPAPLRRAAR